MISSLSEPIFHDIDNIDGSRFGKVGITNKYLFNFFNKIWVPESNNSQSIQMILSKLFPNDECQFIAYIEVEELVKQLFEVFGNDDYGQGLLSDEETIDKDWDGRQWSTSIGSFTLKRLNTYFQLYYNSILEDDS